MCGTATYHVISCYFARYIMKRSFHEYLSTPDVKDTLHKLHANYVLVPADKAANNVIIVCKKYHIDTLVEELGINYGNINNPTYIQIDDSFETIVKSHNQFITSVGLEMSEEDQNLPYLYWTPRLHKSPYKHRFISGSSKCITKDLSCPLTKVLSTIKDGLVRYCNTKTSHNGVNMWILKNSTSLLSSLDQIDVLTAGFSLGRLHMGGFAPPPYRGQSVNGGTHEGGHKSYGGT